jgi:hypothetical protein
MTAFPGRRIAPALAALVLASAAAVAGEEPAKVHAAVAEPPWLLFSAIALVGTLVVGGLAVLWARMLERAGQAAAKPRTRRIDGPGARA